MNIRFAIATTIVVVILLIGAACAVWLVNEGNPLTGLLAGIVSMMAAAGTYYLLSPDRLAKNRAAASEAATTARSHPEVHQDPALRRTILDADREQGTGGLSRRPTRQPDRTERRKPMADYIATARTNYFRVKDLEAFRQGLPADMDVRTKQGSLQDADNDTRIALFSNTGHGTWPSTIDVEVQLDPETGEPVGLAENVAVFYIATETRDGRSVDVATISFDVAEYVCDHLATGEVAYGLEVGAEKLRNLGGYGWATNGEQVLHLHLEDELLHRIEAEFDTKPATLAHY